MTDYTDLIARLRDVADSGTHGPWVAVYHDTYSEVVRHEGSFTSIADVQEYSDAIVIADSRQLVPEAAAAITALQAERDALLEQIRDWEVRIDDCEWSANTCLTEGIRAEMRAALTSPPRTAG